MSLPERLSPGTSVSNENTPSNNQYSQFIDDQCTHMGCAHDSVCSTAQNEQESSSFGKFSEPIYKGEGFHGSSSFQDLECGEPVRAQHLQIDFSPVEGVDDNEYIVKKVRDFWEFLERNSGVKGLEVLPFSASTIKDSNEKSEHNLPSTKDASMSAEIRAVDWLKNEGLMRNAFVTKHNMRYCDSGDGDSISKRTTQRSFKKKHADSSATASRHNVRRRSFEPSSSANLPVFDEVAVLCKQLEAWDSSHPKSMDPPGQPPKLCQALMQRETHK